MSYFDAKSVEKNENGKIKVIIQFIQKVIENSETGKKYGI